MIHQGRFRFNDYESPSKGGAKVEVIECNRYCECPPDCFNRVSQRPRVFPLEIFKTPNCGWGVRATTIIKKGEVVGIHTGYGSVIIAMSIVAH